MNRVAILTAPLLAMTLNACGSGFYGPPQPVRLSHIDGSTRAGEFNCVNGTLIAPGNDRESAVYSNLGFNFSQRVCASFSDQDNEDLAGAMVNSGITLVRTRCSDFFAAKQTNQGRARLVRSLIQPLTIAITSTFAVVNFGSEQKESDALALLAAGNALATAGLNIYEDQFLFGAENVYSVQALTMRALSAHQSDIQSADPSTFDAGVRVLLDHQSICTPGNILELVRAAIDNGDFRPRDRDDGGNQNNGIQNVDENEGQRESNTIELSLPRVERDEQP